MKAASSILFLLLSATACSKKEDSTPVPTLNTGSYIVDGRSTAGTAKAYFQGPGNAGTDDRLTVILTSSPPSIGNEIVTLVFNKMPSAPESTYQLQILSMNQGLGRAYYNYTANVVSTLVKTSTGGYSGTFSGFSPITSPYPASTITQGVFTNVSL